MAKTLLLQSKRHCPSLIRKVLCPFASNTEVHFHSILDLDENGLSPIELVSGMKDDFDLKDFHKYGFSVLVLDYRNQSGIGGTLKWDPNSRPGVHLRPSLLHDVSIALVLNLKTGHISPQFHLTFDDELSTLSCLNDDVSPSNWVQLFLNHA